MDNLSLDSVSSLVHISLAYFSLFPERDGRLVLLIMSRVTAWNNDAVLDFTSLPTYKIAEKVGYGNVKYFNKLFKQSMGVSPKDYRNRAKSQPY